ncbi:MAG: hypothetical protein OQL28_08305 [Sedimenticola sp.]|nr:hypothetical protein [Sedimenticola sp.]
MKFLALFHIALVIVFAALNGIMLYLFMLQLPYGVEPFLISLANWDKLSPQIGYVAGACAFLAVFGAVMVQRLPEQWKNRLLYARWHFPHPSSDAFLTSRRQPFEGGDLQALFPQVKDAGFSRRVQQQVWENSFRQLGDRAVVLNTRIHWDMLRDLYLLCLYFLALFALGWLLNLGVPFQIVAIYLFLFGAQALFLMFAARRTGYRLVDNVLALELGQEEEKGGVFGRRRK